MAGALIGSDSSVERHGVRTPRKAALAGWVGSALEYYDFLIYATAAALVFPSVFFPSGHPAAAVIASLATFGVGYAARPAGALFMGHWGDRFGRKNILVTTLLMMGASTFLVGCLPTYDQVGLLAPGLLVLLRLLQGLSTSGEQAGASSITLEHAPSRQRAFYSSFVLSGTQAGQMLASAVFLPLTAFVARDQLISGAWRIPFLLSAVVIAFGYAVRRTLLETPAFEEQAAQGAAPRQPLQLLFRNSWTDVIRVIIVCQYSVLGTIIAVWTLSFGTATAKVDPTVLLLVATLSNLIALAAIPLFGALADHIGRKPVFVLGALSSAVGIFVYIWSVSINNVPLIFICGVLLWGVCGAAMLGTVPSLIGEMFSTRVRLSGMAVGTQIGYGLSGLAPTIAATIAAPGPDGWPPVATFCAACCVLAAVAAASARETYRLHMLDLGKRQA